MFMNKYRRWTKEDDLLLKKLYQDKTLKELSSIFLRSVDKVYRRASKLGIKKDKKIIAANISKTHKELYRRGVLSNAGEDNSNWKGGDTPRYGGIDKNKYSRIHKWLKANFPKPYLCENIYCTGVSENYSWAKLKGKEYLKKRDNFIMLCRSCHVKYDNKSIKYKIKLRNNN